MEGGALPYTELRIQKNWNGVLLVSYALQHPISEGRNCETECVKSPQDRSKHIVREIPRREIIFN